MEGDLHLDFVQYESKHDPIETPRKTHGQSDVDQTVASMAPDTALALANAVDLFGDGRPAKE